MKTRILLGLALLFPAPVTLFADARTDREIEDAAKSSYSFRKVLDHKVDIKVRDGVATLTGTVQTDDQRRIAEDTVAGLQGVTRVDNRLRVSPDAGEGSDEWIAMKIRTMLAMRRNVSMTDTDVLVRDGVVTLTGTAESQAQKELTAAYAKDIDGVRKVENRIEVLDAAAQRPRVVDDRARDDRDTETLGEKIDDGSITAQIKFELFAHRSTSGLKTNVDTHSGHVVIAGEAQNEAERELVTKLARNVRGVLSVDNKMTVKGR